MALQQRAYHSDGWQPKLRAMLRTATEVAEGMAYIHSRRIVHGDLSSRNVLLMHAHSEADATAKVTSASYLHSPCTAFVQHGMYDETSVAPSGDCTVKLCELVVSFQV